MQPRADGIHLRHRSSSGLGRQTLVDRHFRQRQQRLSEQITMWDEHHTRKLRGSLRLSGVLLLRAAERAKASSLFQEPPRTTRARSQGTPQNCTLQAEYGGEQPLWQAKKSRAAARRDQRHFRSSQTLALTGFQTGAGISYPSLGPVFRPSTIVYALAMNFHPAPSFLVGKH